MGIATKIWEGLGKSPRARVINLCLVFGMIGLVTAVTMNLRFGYNTPMQPKADCHCSGWWIQWGPAATVTVDYKRVQSTGGPQ